MKLQLVKIEESHSHVFTEWADERVLRFKAEIRQDEELLEILSNNINCEPVINKAAEYLGNPYQLWLKASIQTKVRYQKWFFPEGVEYLPQIELRTNTICYTYRVLTQKEIEFPVNCCGQDLNLHPRKVDNDLNVARIPIPPPQLFD